MRLRVNGLISTLECPDPLPGAVAQAPDPAAAEPERAPTPPPPAPAPAILQPVGLRLALPLPHNTPRRR